MKKWWAGIFLAAIVLGLSGCHREKPVNVQDRVVTRIDILCEEDGQVLQKSYTSPEKMRLVLLYIRSVSSPFTDLPEPPDTSGRMIRITTTSANNITKVYRQQGERFFQEGDGGWQRIAPEKGGILWELIQAMPTDEGEEKAGPAGPLPWPEVWKNWCEKRSNFFLFFEKCT